MHFDRHRKRDLYYTNDHEWIDFQGAVAFVGICRFKLTGFRKIQKIQCCEPSIIQRDKIIARIFSNEFEIKVHMPVAGKILTFNDIFHDDQNLDQLLRYPEDTGWLFKIAPLQPYERKDLLSPALYAKKNQGIKV
ncbi:MAG: hypothetical protein JST87_18015 [Bacteroidetes bacterium]|nr:hypothetical protein [Bacteroidota bacterium]